jgi:hypothetical protein
LYQRDVTIVGLLHAFRAVKGSGHELGPRGLLCLQELCSSRRWTQALIGRDEETFREMVRAIGDVVKATLAARKDKDALELAAHFREILSERLDAGAESLEEGVLQIIEGLQDFLKLIPEEQSEQAVGLLVDRLHACLARRGKTDTSELISQFFDEVERMARAMPGLPKNPESLDPSDPLGLRRLVSDWGGAWARVLDCLNPLAGSAV